MAKIHFRWQKSKNALNLKNHKVTFEEARSVFVDDLALLIDDPEHSEDEDRFIMLGLTSTLKLLVVCHCYRDLEADVALPDDEDEAELDVSGPEIEQSEGKSVKHIIRIISARKATKSELKPYRRK
jgi:uncharacterized protein